MGAHNAPKWWVIREDVLLDALREAAIPTSDPEVVMLELLANSDTQEVPPDA